MRSWATPSFLRGRAGLAGERPGRVRARRVAAEFGEQWPSCIALDACPVLGETPTTCHTVFWSTWRPLPAFCRTSTLRGCGFDARVQKVGPIALGEYGSTRRCPRLEMRGSLNGGSSAATRRPWPGPSPGHHYFAIRNRHAVAHCKLSGGAPIARAQIRGESAAEPGFSDPSVEQTRGRGRGAS